MLSGKVCHLRISARQVAVNLKETCTRTPYMYCREQLRTNHHLVPIDCAKVDIGDAAQVLLLLNPCSQGVLLLLVAGDECDALDLSIVPLHHSYKQVMAGLATLEQICIATTNIQVLSAIPVVVAKYGKQSGVLHDCLKLSLT